MGKKSKKEVKIYFYYFFNYIFQINNIYFQEKAASKIKTKRKLSRKLKEKKKPKKEILADIVTSKKMLEASEEKLNEKNKLFTKF
jgi:hypothetical protein